MIEKVLLITGSSSDVGMRLFEDVYDDYSTIFLQYRSMNDELQSLLTGKDIYHKVIPIQADFVQIEDVYSMINTIREFGKHPNAIVHLPFPKAYNKQFHKDKWDNYDLAWNISVRSIVLILQEFIKDMSRDNYGRIVFMLSNYVLNIPPKYQSSYVTVKYALLGLLKSISSEYCDKGITINGISPELMKTKFVSDLPSMMIEQYIEFNPTGREVLIEEVLPVIRYMLSDLGASMTGQNIGISGGR